MLLIKKEIALHAFNNGFNCAQSVLKTRALNQDINIEQAMALSSGFGGGMGRLQNTCGAVTGAYMGIGLHNSKNIEDPENRKVRTSEMIQQFQLEFEKINGSSNCGQLLNCNLNTEEGRKQFEQNQLGKKICEKCIISSLDILETLLN